MIGSMGYRAPEFLVGLSIDFQCDIWSAAATLCELLTGKILYKGVNDNQMLLLQMELCGNFPKKLVKRAAFREEHFNDDGVFLERRVDPLSKVELRVPRADLSTPIKSFEKDVLRNVAKSRRKKRAEFANLLVQMFTMDPSKRPGVKECMKHAFFHSPAR
uniref:Protein kinase domain-containing protein n=1 Tax=Lotharella oceanica TaxID=641309 RepID=A0A7S2TSR3_9EUKA|mmetsp:Transcript_28304/g.52871  ORF Transcript_28304/g.52871 Transcript_28304/m.52871 type:complete len:160 (+) Transcript_28304:123-602(+)